MDRRYVIVFLLIAGISFLSACGKEHSDQYYSNGALKSKGDLTRGGLKNGKWQYWYDNGSLMSEGMYRDGVKVGKWTDWSKDGRVLAVRDFGAGAARPHSKAEAGSADSSLKSDEPAEFAATMEELKKNKEEHVEVQGGSVEKAGTSQPSPGKSFSGYAATMEEWKEMKSGGHTGYEPAVEPATESIAEPVEEEPQVIEEEEIKEEARPVEAEAPRVEMVYEEEAPPVEEAPAIEEPLRIEKYIEKPAPPVVEEKKEEPPVVERRETEVVSRPPVRESAPSKTRGKSVSGSRFWIDEKSSAEKDIFGGSRP